MTNSRLQAHLLGANEFSWKYKIPAILPKGLFISQIQNCPFKLFYVRLYDYHFVTVSKE